MRVQVFGPAYLDRVLRVDRPLIDPEHGPPLDVSVPGALEPGAGLTLADARGHRIVVDPLPRGWPGPTGTVHLRPFVLPGDRPGWSRRVAGVSWHDDLGGMGAGYAAALAGELTCALGAEDDPTSRAVAGLLAREGVATRPIRVEGRAADWTLLVTSAEHGDKLPVGFRGCHDAVAALPEDRGECDLRVAASFPNRLAAEALEAAGARVRLFAPAWRNVADRDFPIARFAEAIDILCCNRREWEAAEERGGGAEPRSLLAITDGARGCRVRFRGRGERFEEVALPAFPRRHPPRDTNRAGEAFASTLVAALLEGGWEADRPADVGLVRRAAWRASAAAALVLDRERFGFASAGEIDEALARGGVGGPGGDGAAAADG